jgi:hypothetical protein
MGGFMEYDGNQPIRVLLPDNLEPYSLTGNSDFPRISKAEIEDRSKGDAISKGVVILQTGWFVTQCIARGVQGLPITELELATVAFAALNFVIYVLWWDKPQNVHRGVRVYRKRITEEPIDDGDVEGIVGFWVALGYALSDIPAAIIRGPDLSGFAHSPWLVRVLLWPLFKPVNILVFSDVVDRVQFGNRVTTFYPPEWVRSSKTVSMFLMGAITVAFGVIHCIGWSFHFPSSFERTLWRVASLSITGVPLMFFPLFRIGKAIGASRYPYSHYYYSNAIIILPLFLYILSRLALLVLPFLCLRSLPPTAFHVVQWTSFIPHI